MAQVTLYMDEETLGRLREEADAAGLSMSAWLVELVRERTRSTWPAGVAGLAGAWRDLADADELRCTQPPDVWREPL